MIIIDVDDTLAFSTVRALEAKFSDLSPVLYKIGEDLTEIAHKSFDTETSPWGTPWTARQKDTGRKILTGETGQLNDSIYYRVVGEGSVEIGDPMVYAAIHQFGGQTRPHKIVPRNKMALAFDGGVFRAVNHPGSKIPARPFMPVTQYGDLAPVAEQSVLKAIEDFLAL